MEYNAEIFQEKEDYINYETFPYYATSVTYGFYTFYKNEKGIFLPLEDKESLKERIYFYQKYISKEKYPVYTSKFGLRKDSNADKLKMSQVLSIPPSILDSKENNYFYSHPEELLNYIQFDSKLKRSFTLDTNETDIIKSNHQSILLAINYLIKNGFYFLNPERIYDDSLNDEEYYPIYIHEEKIPTHLRNEKTNGHKLLMDFVSNPFDITNDIFHDYFENVKNLSLTEMVDISFNDSENNKTNAHLKLALRKYIYALIRKLLNEFYEKETKKRGLAKFTVLDHDFKLESLPYHKIYQGSKYYMICENDRSFTIKNSIVKQTFNENDYLLDSSCKVSLIHAFNSVQTFFKKHPQYNYLPSLFLKLMGLPYPAFEKLKYFDFENGTALAFLSFLKFKDKINVSKYGLLLSLLNDNGEQISFKDDAIKLNAYYNELSNQGLFMSTNFPFKNGVHNCFLFHLEEPIPEKFKPIISGNIDFYKSVFDFDAMGNEFKKFLLSENENGNIKSIKKFYEYLQDGYTSYEALSLLNKNRHELFILQLFISVGLTNSFYDDIEKSFNKVALLKSMIVLNNFNDETFYDPYLKYPYVYKGRNFIAYSDGKNIFFDEHDKESILTLLHIIEEYSTPNKKMSPFRFRLFVFGREVVFEVEKFKNSTKNILLLLGLPKIVFPKLKNLNDIKDLNFEKNISIFKQQNHLELLRNDASLNRLFIFSEALHKGIYLYNFKDIIIRDKRKVKDSSLMMFFDLKQIFTCLHKDYYSSPNSTDFKSTVNAYLFDEYNQNINHLKKTTTDNLNDIKDSLSFYAISFNEAFTNSLYSKHLNIKSNTSSFGIIKKDDFYIAIGKNFYAVSKTGNIDDFALLNTEKEKLDEIILMLTKYYKSKKSFGDINSKIVYSLGLPNVLVKKAYETLSIKKTLSSSDFSFSSIELETITLPSYLYPFDYEYINSYNFISNTQLNFNSIQNGLFFFHVDDEIKTNFGKKNLQQMKEHMLEIKYCPFVILKDRSEFTNSIFMPSIITFNNLLNQYSDAFIKNYGYSKELVLKLKEFLIYNYLKSNEYLISLNNDFYLSSLTQFSKKIAESLSLFEMTNNLKKDDIKKAVYFINQFVYTFKGRYICALNAKLQKSL